MPSLKMPLIFIMYESPGNKVICNCWVWWFSSSYADLCGHYCFGFLRGAWSSGAFWFHQWSNVFHWCIPGIQGDCDCIHHWHPAKCGLFLVGIPKNIFWRAQWEVHKSSRDQPSRIIHGGTLTYYYTFLRYLSSTLPRCNIQYNECYYWSRRYIGNVCQHVKIR